MPARHTRWRLALVAGCWAAAACADFNTTSPLGMCAAPRSIAIEVAVSDSVTGRALADSAAGFVHTGTRTDSLFHVAGSAALLDGGDQLGTYDVTVARPGYATWMALGVHVTRQGVCGNVLPEQRAARLQAIP